MWYPTRLLCLVTNLWMKTQLCTIQIKNLQELKDLNFNILQLICTYISAYI